MTGTEIECPHCGESFELTGALAAPLLESERLKAREEATRALEVERADIEARAAAKAEAAMSKRLAASEAAVADRDQKLLQAQEAELAARKARDEAEQAKRDIELTVQRRVDTIRAEVAKEAVAKANAEAAVALAAKDEELQRKDAKLRLAQDAEIEARRIKQEAEEAKREVELTVTRRLDEERIKVRDAALREKEDEHRLKLADKDKQLQDLAARLEEAQRKASQGSQQLVGDVLELDLIDVLQQAFPTDRFERVKKGNKGADVQQTVISPSGAEAGTILWESKRTKNWQEPWLAKLREDQREAKADIAALATETLPAGINAFGERDRIWVTSLPTVVPVAASLRYAIISVATARRAGALAESKKDQVFNYLVSPQFGQRMSRITESYVEMRSDLDKEKRAIVSMWGKREKQLDHMLGGVSGFYGDLSGLVGSGLPAVHGLSLPAPEDGADKPKLSVVAPDSPAAQIAAGS
jgi:hypothetical protein